MDPFDEACAMPSLPNVDDEPTRTELLADLHRLEKAARPLEPGASVRKRLRSAVISSSERFLRRVKGLNAFVETDDKGIGLLRAPISEHGLSIDRVIELLEHDVIRPGGHPASSGYLAYIPGGGIYPAALGDYLAAVSDKYAGVFFAGPGPVRMENMLIRWVADLLGYPAGGAGNIASGGSIANLTAIATARDAHGLKSADVTKAVVYLTSQAHHSIYKALHLTGLGEAQVRQIAVDECFRMRPEALEEAIAADRLLGFKPWLVVGAAGATDTGAVDPLDAIADVCQREGCWFHVDAAYGGFFLLTAHGRRMLKGIERSDSAILDPHKSLFLPWGSGIVVVRDGRALAATHQFSGHYMQDVVEDSSAVSPSELSPELTKHFRALRLWLPLLLLGVKPFRAALEEKLLLARYFRLEIEDAGFEVGPVPDLSIVTFRFAREGAALEGQNGDNHALVDRIRRDGRIFLSSTMLDGRFTLRMAVLGFRTHQRTIDLAVRILRDQRDALITNSENGR